MCFSTATDNSYNGTNTEQHQDHVVCIYGYKLICADEQYSQPCKSEFGKIATEKVLNDMVNEIEFVAE